MQVINHTEIASITSNVIIKKLNMAAWNLIGLMTSPLQGVNPKRTRSPVRIVEHNLKCIRYADETVLMADTD